MKTDNTNINFQLATDFINYTSQSIFLTGKAGTGKTTFLRYIRENSIKNQAVVAPTGVAAINAGGVTIHSFFQLPFNPFIPEGSANLFNNVHALDKHSLLGRIRITGERRKIFQQLELLIIDEISMVRADVLDAIDTILKHFRNRYNEPFGGVQLLLIGDMFQLPPVAKDEEWSILGQYYKSPYFFCSRVLQNNEPVCIELTKIYRQNDEKFISLLNKVRNNEMDDADFEDLHELYQPDFKIPKNDDYILLTTHNYKADAINNEELALLKGKVYSFKAEIRLEFNEKSYPADEVLQLKVGAQVMFMKNDLDKAKRYFNGKIGIVEKIEDAKIFVRCKNEPEAIEVEKYVWENKRYTLNIETQKVEEETVGSFSQYPLRLAWAITIHKSQGLTFEKAVIDAGQAFAAGQVYVALSRCTNLHGIVLLSKIYNNSLKSDERIIDFTNQQKHAQLTEGLKFAKQEYQQGLLTNLFNLTNAEKQVAFVARIITESKAAFSEQSNEYITILEQRIISLNEVAKKFQAQIAQHCTSNILPEENEALQERIKKAAAYFNNELNELISYIKSSLVVTDSKQYSYAFDEEFATLFQQLTQKHHLIQSCLEGFDVSKFHQAKNSFVLPYFGAKSYALKNKNFKIESPHPELYQKLRKLRDTLAETKQMAIYMIADAASIDEMARYLPQNATELKKIKGFGEAKVEKFGFQFLDIIQRYCNEHHLESLIHEKELTPAKEKVVKEKSTKEKSTKPDTKKESFRLFSEGKTIAEIAAERNLTTQTIEGHLSHFVATGELDVLALISAEKLQQIESLLPSYSIEEGLSVLKEKVGEAVSYSELKLFLAYKKHQEVSAN